MILIEIKASIFDTLVTFFGITSLWIFGNISYLSSVKEIGDSAFENCKSLNLIELPLAETVYSNAFNGCEALTTLTLPATITEVGEYAFYKNEALGTSVTPNLSNLTKIGAYAFANLSNAVEAKIGKDVTFIGENAFNACYNLMHVTIPSSVTTIGNSAFYQCLKGAA